MRRLGEGIEEALDVNLGSARDDNLQPRDFSCRIREDVEDTRATPIVAAFIKCVDDKDEWMFWMARNGADEIKEEGVLHRIRREVRVAAKAVGDNCSKWREVPSEFANESWKDISRFAQISIIPPAEKRSSELPMVMEHCADRMSQRCFPDSR